jgi:hypothetical protein
MAFGLQPGAPLVPGAGTIPSAALNAWRANFPSCVDGVQGGTYNLVSNGVGVTPTLSFPGGQTNDPVISWGCAVAFSGHVVSWPAGLNFAGIQAVGDQSHPGVLATGGAGGNGITASALPVFLGGTGAFGGQFTGVLTYAGVYGMGGASVAVGGTVSSVGVYGIAGPNGTAGVYGLGQGTSAAQGVGVLGLGTGATGVTVPTGAGVVGFGGPTNAYGVYGIGGATGIGGYFLGGGGNAQAINGIGAGTGAGGRFLNSGTSLPYTAGPSGNNSIEAYVGPIWVPTNPSSVGMVGGTNTLWGSNICKAWAFVSIAHGSGTVTILGGHNIASASYIAVTGYSGGIQFTFATNMGGASSYAVSVSPVTTAAGQPDLGGFVLELGNSQSPPTAAHFTVCATQITGSPGSAGDFNGGSSTRYFSVFVFGTQ